MRATSYRLILRGLGLAADDTPSRYHARVQQGEHGRDAKCHCRNTENSYRLGPLLTKC